MAEENPNAPTTWLVLLREITAGVIALVVVILFAVLLTRAMRGVANDAELAAAKELLGMVNPLMGLVVGYYFSRVTSEARAERAEATVTATLRSAERASAAREQAELHERTVRERASDLAHALEGLTRAAEQTIAPAAAQEAMRPADRGGDLERALDHARRVLGRDRFQV